MIVLIANAHPYLVVLTNLPSPQSGQGCQNDPAHHRSGKHRKAPTLARIRTHQKTRPPFTTRSCRMSSTCSDPAYEMNAPALIKHGSLRPASRDLSGGARSGNANQITRHMKQASCTDNPADRLSYLPPDPRPISSRLGNQRDSIGPGLEHDRGLRSHLEASRQNLLFTMYQNRRRAEAMRNLCISPKDNVVQTASRSRRLLRKRVPRQRHVRLRGTTWWSLSGSNR